MHENEAKLNCEHGRLRRSCDQCAADGEIKELRAALAAVKQENESLRAGAPLGPIIGASTILHQEQELKRLRVLLARAAKLLPLPSVLSEVVDGAVLVVDEGIAEDNSEDEVEEASEVVAWYRAVRDVHYYARLYQLQEGTEEMLATVADLLSQLGGDHAG